MNWLVLIPKRLKKLQRGNLIGNRPPNELTTSFDSHPEHPNLVLLIYLGSGVNGFDCIVHEGMICFLFDEALITAIETNYHLWESIEGTFFTANLNTDFLRPLRSPVRAIVKVWARGREGRKWRLQGTLENDQGTMRAKAGGL